MNLNSKTLLQHNAQTGAARRLRGSRDVALENELRLKDDLDMAREVQQQLLPRARANVPGLDLAATCVPAYEVGGDFYDFLPYGSGRFALALGDVSGKGTAAALLAALTIGILRAHTVEHASPPDDVLAMLNDRITAARLNTRFVAMLFAVLDSNTRQLKIANAGSPYPLLLRNGRIEEIPLSGIPLGLMAGTRYEAVLLDVKFDDVVVFVSDGILECPNSKHEAFGTEGLAAVLTSLPSDTSAEEIASAVLSVTDVFSGYPTAVYDDRSLIVLRVTEESWGDHCRIPLKY